MSKVLKDITEECVTKYDPEWGYVVTYKWRMGNIRRSP